MPLGFSTEVQYKSPIRFPSDYDDNKNLLTKYKKSCNIDWTVQHGIKENAVYTITTTTFDNNTRIDYGRLKIGQTP